MINGKIHTEGSYKAVGYGERKGRGTHYVDKLWPKGGITILTLHPHRQVADTLF